MKISRLLKLMLAVLIITAAGCEEEEETVYGDWVKRSDFDGVARSDASSFSIGEKGYVFGGYDGKIRLTDLWEYNAELDYWTQKATFPGIARTSATAFSIGGKGYVGVGYNGDIYFKDFWEYDPSSNIWTRKADFGGSARLGSVSFSLNGFGYAGAGYDGNYLKDMWKYNPVDNTWTQIVSLGGSKRSYGTSFVYNNKAYVVCGVNNGTYITDFWQFDPQSETWLELRPIADKSDEDYDDEYSIAKSNALAMITGNRIFITCGESGSIRGDTWEYFPDTDLWEETTEFEGTSRTAAVEIHSSTKSFILTGRSSTYRFDDMWEFLPDIEYDENY